PVILAHLLRSLAFVGTCILSGAVTFVLLIIPRPPTSPLFPYTTLFRSLRRGDLELLGEPERGEAVRQAEVHRLDLAALVRGHLVDRKSTRLNSSHVKTSYAVFCLKKKSPLTTDVSTDCIGILDPQGSAG